ncbi:2-isopropylmalate synthase [Eubacteriales bacterium OttesenSCG-928-N13]|nr:2-isopropylmalate synthase [Eubacteriales bacterium OttesenSCG-928-N13]
MHANHKKYLPFEPIRLPDRRWPSNRITKPPIWCSVDLRDGNQALPEPMNLEEKLMLFDALVGFGFKQIEVGFPSASEVEFQVVRTLIEENRIPDDVTIQVLTPARDHLIERTFEALEGCERAIVHLYNNISPVFRELVFHTDKQGVLDMAVRGATKIRELADARPDGGKDLTIEYSPEMFSGSEMDFALSVCEQVLDALGATTERPVILNLPSTVQMSTPNDYADQIEYFIRQLPNRERAIISCHPHNDRGTGVADAELAMLAGAQRLEGTLFGNGERTGNLDLVIVALNLFTQGIDPGLDFSQLNDLKRVYERSTRMRIHERQPYSGELVFTAFSGSHQDAIKKALDHREQHHPEHWQVPYLPIDPADLGRMYEPIIRINSQSGKGGAAYVLHSQFGYNLPRTMHPEFGTIVQREADRLGQELSAEQLLRLFISSYCDVQVPYHLMRHDIVESGQNGQSIVKFTGLIGYRTREYTLRGEGNGPIDAFFSAMHEAHIDGFEFVSYHEHAIGKGSDAKAVAYIELRYNDKTFFGVGVESNVSIASIKGVLSAVNRALQMEE